MHPARQRMAESAADHAGRYCAHAFWMHAEEGTVLQASRMQMIMFQHSSPQFDSAVPHSGASEQLHSAHAVVSGRCGVQRGTVGVGRMGTGVPGIIGVPGTTIGAIGIV
jgi:hypothetical protein